MTNPKVNFIIRTLRLRLENGALLADGRPLSAQDAARIESDRNAIVEELAARVVPFPPRRGRSGKTVEDVDPWRHAGPGINRMHLALSILADWRAKGFKIRVEPGKPIRASDLYNAKTHVAPSRIKPELLWLLAAEDLQRPVQAPPVRTWRTPGNGAA